MHNAPSRPAVPVMVAAVLSAATSLSLMPAADATPPLGPCDWVTAREAAELLGTPSARTRESGNQSGSLEQRCDYDAQADQVIRQVSSVLKLPGSFPVDAQTAFDGIVARGRDSVVPGTDVSGLPGPAFCTYSWGTGGGGDELDVVLDEGRMYSVLVWRNDHENDSCEIAKSFAATAIQRIGD